MAGRKAAGGRGNRKSASTDAVDGNPSGRKRGGAVPRPAMLTEAPAPPDTLGEHGRELWHRVAPYLVDLGLLSVLDVDALRVLCESWQVYCSLAEYDSPDMMFVVSDRGNVSEHPAVKRRALAAETCQRLWKLFGLTPADREKMEVDIPQQDDGPDIHKFARSR